MSDWEKCRIEKFLNDRTKEKEREKKAERLVI